MATTRLDLASLSKMDGVTRHAHLVDEVRRIIESSDGGWADFRSLPVNLRALLVRAASDEILMSGAGGGHGLPSHYEMFLSTFTSMDLEQTQAELFAAAEANLSDVNRYLLTRHDMDEDTLVLVVANELTRRIHNFSISGPSWDPFITLKNRSAEFPLWMARSLMEDVGPAAVQSGFGTSGGRMFALDVPVPPSVRARMLNETEAKSYAKAVVFGKGTRVSLPFRYEATDRYPELVGLPDDLLLDVLASLPPSEEEWPSVPATHLEVWGKMVRAWKANVDDQGEF